MKDKLIKAFLFLLLLSFLGYGCRGSDDGKPVNELAPKVTTNGKLDISKVVKTLEQVRLGLPAEECERLFGKPSSHFDAGGDELGDMTIVIRSWDTDHKRHDLVVWSNKKNDVAFHAYMTIAKKTDPDDLLDMRDRLTKVFGSRGSPETYRNSAAIRWRGAKGTRWELRRYSNDDRSMQLSRELE